MKTNPAVLEKLEGRGVLLALIAEALGSIRDLGFKHDEPIRNGGTLVIARAEDGLVILMLPIGRQNPDKADKYRVLAQEKATRLAHMAKEKGHVTSMQSRDPDSDQYGGAVLFSEGVIVSFSGLKEMDDETLSRRVGTAAIGLMLA